MERVFVNVINLATKDTSCVMAFEKFEEGDTVVVDYKYGNNTPSVRKVLNMTEAHSSLDVKGVVIGKVDRTVYDRVIEKAEKRRQLEDALRRRVMVSSEEDLWRAMANYDPEMERLLKEYDEVKR